ncbi:endonuclease YncB(thermonuclease family) [Rossellomorea marisflavi]
MSENTNESRTWHKWPRSIALLSLLVVVPLAGCGDASKTDSDTDQKGQAKSEEKADEKAASKEDLEEEFGDVETPESELTDITEEVTVMKVEDGDTIVVNGENGEETITLALADAPELTLPDGSQDENFGMKARDYSRSMLEGATLLFERSDSKDEDGNATGYIWMKNGVDHVNFNKGLIEKGLARLAETSDAKYTDEFREAESQAKAEKKDIWSIDGYVTADGYNSSLVQ